MSDFVIYRRVYYYAVRMLFVARSARKVANWSGELLVRAPQLCYDCRMENQNKSNEAQELHATVRGRVQGVGFRYFVIEKALGLGLRGYARNTGDGSVEVLAQGKRSALENLLALLRRGPAAADVREVETSWGEPSGHFSGFHVRF